MLRLTHRVRKNARTALQRRGFTQTIPQTCAEENIIAKNQTDRIRINETFSNDKSFGQTARLGLFCIRKRKTPLLSIAEQTLKRRQIFRRTDDENLANARQHQHRERIIDHRLVVDRKNLFAHAQGQWIEARTASAREDYAFHFSLRA